MKSAVLTLAIALGATSVASAARKMPENVTVVKRNSVVEDSSAYNRMDKDVTISYQLTGIAVVPSNGLNVGYFLNRNTILQLEYAEGKMGFTDFDIKARTIGANAKYFFGNSFYGKGGVAYRSVGVYNLECVSCKAGSRIDLGSADSVGAEVAIGNQWQWEYFTLGCDWLGAMVPFSTTKVANNAKAAGVSDDTNKEIDDIWNRIGKTTSIQLLRFYLGASF